ncbi:hypothetical protein [Pseudorhodoplanes sinuspersici]|uniref:Uncharacterized protein n=1 Tax=Pseudorhodoplanes sinuspersici TaxID=1235591 RepID=A0A1W6ZPP2_9HYPH|nr:hypothetical protein [Pseudorhodoplanes sinuspersici]ARP99366.1 hypothetical protein CAK95_09935 [Pseudorhodoplanes sinuspersici]RKE70302.1 hypothetical protein DFP91_2533 [Pseudorhodoplanes sinuspersici]
MPSLLSRLTFSTAVLLASVLVHLGLFGVIVLADRRTPLQSETRPIDVELVKQDEVPEPLEPPKVEPPKPAPPEPEPPKAELPEPELPKAEMPKPAEQQSAAAPPLPPPPAPMPSGQVSRPQELEAKSARAEPQAPPDKPDRVEKPAGISGGPPSESKSKLTPEEIAALRAQVQKCWKLPVGMPGVLGLELIIRVSFGPKGQLAGEPVILKAPASERGPLLAGISLNALKDCAPYRMPAAKYKDWKVLDLRFLATGMTGLGVAPKVPAAPQAKR